MEIRINSINKAVFEQARKAFSKFIVDECDSLEGVTVVLRADEININHSADPLASDMVTIHLYNRSMSLHVQGFTGLFQLYATDFRTLELY